VSRIGVGATWYDRSDGRLAAANIRRPLVSLQSRNGWTVSGQYADARVLRFRDGAPRAADSLRRHYGLLRVDGARALRASPHGYTRVGLTAQLRREDTAPEPLSVPRTVSGAAGPYVEIARPRFLATRNFRALERIEDVNLGWSVGAALLAAPSAWGYEESGIGAAFRAGAGHRLPSGFATLGIALHGVQLRDRLDSGRVSASALVALQPGSRHLFVAHAGGSRIHRPRPGGEEDLGLDYGLRAFPAHSFTGDHAYLASAEYRWLALPRVFDLGGVGVAPFVDHGGAWFGGSRRRSGTDAGVGLRIGALRSGESIMGRIDLAYRWGNERSPAGWVLALGRGWIFERF
jgi:hypothetical protein